MTRILHRRFGHMHTVLVQCAALVGVLIVSSKASAADQDLLTIQAAAESGVVHKQIELGSAYVMGHGVAQDLRLAAYWFQKAAEKGDPAAQNMIGYFYQTGLGVTRDPERAVHWYQLASANGSVIGKVNLGVAYLWGSGVSKNPEVAALLLQEAAKKGSGSAACYLGYMSYSGFGIKQDRAHAERWYRIGVRLHDPLSEFALGTLLSVNDGHPHDIPQAVDLLRKSADAGFVPAMYSLGLLLVNDPDRARSPQEILALLDKATEAGMWKSSVIQGVLARDGKLVPLDSKSAYLHFRIAALQGGSVGESVVHNDIMVLSAKLGPEEAANLDSEASAWVREHHTVLEIIPKDSTKWDRLSGYALSVPDDGDHAGAMIPMPQF